MTKNKDFEEMNAFDVDELLAETDLATPDADFSLDDTISFDELDFQPEEEKVKDEAPISEEIDLSSFEDSDLDLPQVESVEEEILTSSPLLEEVSVDEAPVVDEVPVVDEAPVVDDVPAKEEIASEVSFDTIDDVLPDLDVLPEEAVSLEGKASEEVAPVDSDAWKDAEEMENEFPRKTYWEKHGGEVPVAESPKRKKVIGKKKVEAPAVEEAPVFEDVPEVEETPVVSDTSAPEVEEVEEVVSAPLKDIEEETRAISAPVEEPAESVAPAVVPVANGVKQARPTKVFTKKEEKKNVKKGQKLISRDEIFSDNEYADGFVLSDNEYVLRRYQAFRPEKGSGRITVTNKRILIDAGEVSEVPVEDVTSIKSKKYTKFSAAKVIFGLLFVLICAGVFVYNFAFGGFLELVQFDWAVYCILAGGALFGLIGLIMLFNSKKKHFGLSIYVKGEDMFAEFGTVSKKSKVISSVVRTAPGKDFDKFRREIGALLIKIREKNFD